MISALLSAGVLVAVPFTGWLALGRLGLPIPTVARASLWISAGAAIWSLPLLLLLVLGIYHPELIGAAGWVTVAALVGLRRVRLPKVPRLQTVDRVVLVGLLLAALLTAAFPSDPFNTGRDMGTYANHAVYMVHHGRLDIPYPWAVAENVPAPTIWSRFGHFYPTEPTMTAPFGHVYPAWLAQTYAVVGYGGMVRLNVILGFFALLAIYGLATRFVNARVAAVAILFLAFNPAQMWVTRQTLSEIPSQLLIWSGLLLLTAYLARGRPSWGLWAGILLGFSTLVRIDAFLIVPFLLVAHAFWNVVRTEPDHPPRRSLRYVYLGAVPLFGLALAYYALFSRPYLIQQSAQMLLISSLTVIALVAVAVSRLAMFGRVARGLLSSRVLVGLFLGALAALTVYAYFIRPVIPPFGTIDAPGQLWDGVRSRVEDALPNVGRYLTPGVVWGALIGWSMVFVAVIHRPRARTLIPILIVGLGCAVAYTWNQAVAPQHFWAVRRFVPIIIPALLMFAGLAATVALSRLSLRGRWLALALSIPLLIAFTLKIGLPVYGVAERDGSYANLAEFAHLVPSNGEVLALGGYWDIQGWWVPLYVAFDRPIIPIDVTTAAGWSEAVARIRAASPEKPVTIMSTGPPVVTPQAGTVVEETKFFTTVMDDYVIPVPATSHATEITLSIVNGIGFDTIGVELVATYHWVVLLSGMYNAELINDIQLRWTTGNGQMLIPFDGDAPPDRIRVSLADTGPNGGPLRIVANGTTLFDGSVAPGAWAAELPLDNVENRQLGDTMHVEIISDTFPRTFVGGVELELGVQIQGVTLLAAGE